MNERDRESLYMLRCVLVGVTLCGLGFVLVLVGALSGWGWPITLGYVVMWSAVVAIFAAGGPAVFRAVREYRHEDQK